MTRILAVALLALINVSWISPFFAADPDANLPACCRRDGKHHCALVGSLSSGPAILSAACPSFPGVRAAPAAAKTRAFADRAQVSLTPAASRASAQAQTEALYRISYSRTSQKRGPPSHLSIAL